MISFEELHHFMMLDVFYGVESKATDSIINSIYREYPENPLFKNFSRRFYLLPCKEDNLRHLLYLWCGFLGLPTYREKQLLQWNRDDYLDHWTEDFELSPDDIKTFLRKRSWPLPIFLFPDELDNTERKVANDKNEYEKTFHDFAVVIPLLKKELEELRSISPENMSMLFLKREGVIKLERRIKAIEEGGSQNMAELPEERKARLESWFDEERRVNERGALKRTAERGSLTADAYSYFTTTKLDGRPCHDYCQATYS